jgi:hypothetical protein
LHFWKVKVKVKDEKTNQAGKKCSLLPPKKSNARLKREYHIEKNARENKLNQV